MKQTTIALSTVNDVKCFVSAALKYPYEIDLISGRYAVDGKSILGILSILSMKPAQPIILEAHTDNPSALLCDIQEFLVE